MTNYLDRTYDRYEQRDGTRESYMEYMKALYDRYVKRREESLLDSAAAAAAVGGILYADTIDYDAIDPQMEEAFNLTFPGKSIESLADMSTEELSGIASAWKGKYFEVLVRDELNAGEWVGDIHLDPGQTATLAESATQPGWDLQILDSDGTVAEVMQMKATDSLSYVKEALEKYPDIDILTTDEVAGTLDGVISSGIENEDLAEMILDPMESLLDSPLGNIAEDAIPFLPFLLIAGREGQMFLVGKKSLESALVGGFEKSVKSGIAMVSGAALFAWLDSGIISIAGTFAVRKLIGSYDEKQLIKKDYVQARNELLDREPIYLLNQ